MLYIFNKKFKMPNGKATWINDQEGLNANIDSIDDKFIKILIEREFIKESKVGKYKLLCRIRDKGMLIENQEAFDNIVNDIDDKTLSTLMRLGCIEDVNIKESRIGKYKLINPFYGSNNSNINTQSNLDSMIDSLSNSELILLVELGCIEDTTETFFEYTLLRPFVAYINDPESLRFYPGYISVLTDSVLIDTDKKLAKHIDVFSEFYIEQLMANGNITDGNCCGDCAQCCPPVNDDVSSIYDFMDEFINGKMEKPVVEYMILQPFGFYEDEKLILIDTASVKPLTANLLAQ